MAELSFDENAFRNNVNRALEAVRTILDTSRHPQWPSDVPHQYEDKYLLAEFVATNSIAALQHILQTLGVTEKILVQLKEWAKTRTVSLRLKSEETCKFLRKTTREVESDTKAVTKSTLFGTRETNVVTKVHEWFWQFDVAYELTAFMGNEPENGIRLQGRKGTYEIKTTVETTPKPQQVVRPSVDVNITWLVTHIDDNLKPRFNIDRAAKSCHTPRRNQEVNDAFDWMVSFYRWARSVHGYFRNDLFSVQTDHGIDLKAVNAADIFVPVLPIMEKVRSASKKEKRDKKDKKEKKEKKRSGKHLEAVGDARPVPASLSTPFHSEQVRSMTERFAALAVVFPANDKLVTVAEAKLIVLALHIQAVCQSFANCVDYVEDMLRKQLIAAIGKEVQPTDFTNYLRFHNRKLFRPEFAPRPFCHAIRRPAHVPEGTLSIEAQLDDGLLADPIYTSVCYAPAQRPMKFALSAASEVSFGGDRFLHAYVSHQFSGYSGKQLNLVARARQFSSFILLVGSIAGPDLFMPKYGIIVQNKDELKIPLNLETIPTQKEFKDAISSLSPEQQRFAKGFRSMQLESTLFGVCVIQIKPQLEKLLKLPEDGLTKEIALSQDLLNLFMEYQIPSDLLSYDGPEDATAAAKVNKVREYAANMRQLVQERSQVQLEQAQNEQKLRLADIDVDEDGASSASESEEEVVKKNYRRRSSKMEDEREEKEERKERKSTKNDKSKDKEKEKESDKKVMKKKDMKMKKSSEPSAKGGKSLPTPKPSPPTDGGGAAPVPQKSEPEPPKDAPKEPAKEPVKEEEGQAALPAGELTDDFTQVPQQIEAKFEELDPEAALRPTIITAGDVWSRKRKPALLAAVQTSTLLTEEQGNERNKAFDLLDALTKSGALAIDHAALHVVIAATHCFDKTLMNTVIQDNVNPIEKVERSTLIIASTIQNRPTAALVQPEQLERLGTYSPMLLLEHDDDEDEAPAAQKKEALPVTVNK